MRKAQPVASAAEGDVVPLADAKSNLSRYVRDVQTRGRAFTITHHGRPAAYLGPLPGASRPALSVREPSDPRPLGELELRPVRARVSAKEIQRVLDEEREDRL